MRIGLAAAGLLLAACTSAGTAPEAAPSPTLRGVATAPPACADLSAGMVRAAIGASVDRGREGPGLFYLLEPTGIPANQCDFDLRSNDGRVRIRVTDERARDVLTAIAEGAQPLSGVGDAAIWQSAGATLWVVEGEMLYAIEVPVLPDGPDPRKAAVRIGRSILGAR